MAFGHGGARLGAGAKPGTRFKRATVAVEISQDGKTQPLHVMVENMRNAFERRDLPFIDLHVAINQLISGEEFVGWKPSAIHQYFFNAAMSCLNWEKVSQDYARDAAPYLHNKLQSIDHNMAVAHLGNISELSPDDLLKRLQQKRALLTDPKNAEKVGQLLEFKPSKDGKMEMES